MQKFKGLSREATAWKAGLLAITMATVGAVQAGIIVENRFDSVAELNDWYPNTSGITWINSGGNPSGYALLGDNLGVTYAITRGNGKWDRDLRNAYGGTLSWDFMIYSGYPGDGYFDAPDVELSRDGYPSLYVHYPYDTLRPLPNVWQTYSVPLQEGTWYRATDNQLATKAEILAVLGGGKISIRTEVVSGDDAGALDNIILSEPTPHPELQVPSMNQDGTVVIRWTSYANQLYTIHYSTNLPSGFSVLESNISGTPPMNIYNATMHGVNVMFWKVSMEKQ